MIVPSDPDYVATKRVKLGLDPIPGDVLDLILRLEKRFGVRPLNILYEWEPVVSRPRLQVVLERERDVQVFGGNTITISEEMKDEVRGEFMLCTLARRPIGPRNMDDSARAFIVFSVFDHVALNEAAMAITKEDLAALARRFRDDGVWLLERNFSLLFCFFRTDDELARNRADGGCAAIARAYEPLLKAHDTFGYVEDIHERIVFDSKENLDKNYKGNLFYYYR